MSILNRMQRKNKKSEHYQRNYEEVAVEGKGINIGIGSEGLVRGKQEEKGQYYIDVRKKITSQDREKIMRIANASRTIYEIFSKMEDARMPLDYLVALDLVEEIDIESYQNVKLKGLDAGRTMTGEELTDVDESLKIQVMGQTEELPTLKDSLTEAELDEVGRQVPVDEYQKVVEEVIKDGEETNEVLKDTNEEVVEERATDIEVEVVVDEEVEEVIEDTGNIQEEETTEGTVEKGQEEKGQEEKGQEDKEDEEAGTKEDEGNDLRSLAEMLRKQSEEESKREKKKREREERERIKNIRDVYLIGSDLLLPVIEEYNVIVVRDMSQILEYTSSKRSLLIITQDIPREMQGDLMNWLRGIATSESKYRIVTLEGSAVGHNLIEDTVSLSRESLDKYFQNFPDEDYDGKDVEGFFDISNLIE